MTDDTPVGWLQAIARSVAATATEVVMVVADPVVRGITEVVLDQIDLAPLANRVAKAVDAKAVARSVVQEVDVAPILNQVQAQIGPLVQDVIANLDYQPAVETIIGDLDMVPVVEQVLEQLDLEPIVKRVLDQIDLPALITDTVEDLKMGDVVRAAVRRPALRPRP